MSAIKVSYIKSKNEAEAMQQLRKSKIRSNLQAILKEFASTDNEVMTFNWKESDYQSANTAVKSFCAAINRGGWPMRVHQDNKTIWIEKIK